MSNIVINGKLVEDPVDFKKTSEDLSDLLVKKSQEAFIKQRAEDRKKQHIPKVVGKKIGRNDLCPCGSNKKFKKCCIDK